MICHRVVDLRERGFKRKGRAIDKDGDVEMMEARDKFYLQDEEYVVSTFYYSFSSLDFF